MISGHDQNRGAFRRRPAADNRCGSRVGFEGKLPSPAVGAELDLMLARRKFIGSELRSTDSTSLFAIEFELNCGFGRDKTEPRRERFESDSDGCDLLEIVLSAAGFVSGSSH